MRLPGVVLCAAALVWFSGCDKPPKREPPPPSVEVAAANSKTVPLYIETFGNCASVASVMIVPQVTGILSATRFDEGAMVKEGDILFEIDARPYQAALEQAQGNLETAEADLLNARQILERKQSLFKTKVIDIQELENAEAAVTSAEGAVLSNQGDVEQAQINLGYCRISSPINGKTGRYLINTGNLVTANSSELLNIRTLDPIYVDYTIAESELPKVQHYLAQGGLDVEIRLPNQPDPVTVGKLTFVDNNVGLQTGALGLRATVRNPDSRLVPGQFVRVRLILEELENAVLVPETAVLVGADGDFVFVLKPDATVEQRSVTRGQRENDNIIVESGLAVGEQVVTSGQVALAPGTKVTVVDSDRAAATPQATATPQSTATPQARATTAP